MKRNPRKLGWTKAFRRAAGKEMTVDSTLTFAARRNIPVRYNRDLVDTTIKAMQRVSEIRARRERVFYKKRMEGNKETRKMADAKLVAENEHLLPRIRGSEKRALEEREGMREPLAEDEERAVHAHVQKLKGRRGTKKKLLVGGGTEDAMDVD
ncbi:MAG: hypothetical protein Q9163_002357 [Psora crenata]